MNVMLLIDIIVIVISGVDINGCPTARGYKMLISGYKLPYGGFPTGLLTSTNVIYIMLSIGQLLKAPYCNSINK